MNGQKRYTRSVTVDVSEWLERCTNPEWSTCLWGADQNTRVGLTRLQGSYNECMLGIKSHIEGFSQNMN